MGCCGGAKRFVVGAGKLARAEVGLNVLKDEATIAERRAACESCDRWEHGRCLECGCYTWAKTKLKAEKCPLGKWYHVGTK